MNYSSSHFNGKIFLNPVPTGVSESGAFLKIMKEYFKKHEGQYPAIPPGPFHTDLKLLHTLPPDTLRVTWLGHATCLLEMDGKRFLTDPVWYQRVSPFSRIGPKRFFEVPVALEDLPPIDAILLSHDHYDHLDKEAIIKLAAKKIPVICPLRVSKYLLKWGIDKNLITELDWWQQIDMGDSFVITLTPARHFSGRWLNDRFTTLWASFVVQGPKHNFYYGADSGYYEGFKEMGERFGPLDVTMMNIGAYNEQWASIHMFPEDAVQAHIDLKGKLFLPIHWGTFNLAFHSWTEPVERVITAAKKRGVSLLLPTPGQICTINNGPVNSEWWQKAGKE